MAWDSEDWMVHGFMLFIGALFFVTMLGAIAAIVDTVKERQSFGAITACQASRGVPKRQSLTTHVVCIPDNARQDTSTVNLRLK